MFLFFIFFILYFFKKVGPHFFIIFLSYLFLKKVGPHVHPQDGQALAAHRLARCRKSGQA